MSNIQCIELSDVSPVPSVALPVPSVALPVPNVALPVPSVSLAAPSVISHRAIKQNTSDKIIKPKQVIIIPAGTQVCPERRAVVSDTSGTQKPVANNYYITLEKSIEIEIHNIITCIGINGTTYHIIDESRYDPKIHRDQISGACCVNPSTNTKSLMEISRTIVVPENTPYSISDISKDPIGLIQKFNVDETVRIKPGSSILLPKNTKVVLFDYAVHDTNKEKKERNDVFMILDQLTKCTI
jgi:hypothetical protein